MTGITSIPRAVRDVRLFDGLTMFALDRCDGRTLEDRVATFPSAHLEHILAYGVTSFANINPPAALRAARIILEERHGTAASRARAEATGADALVRRRWIGGEALTNYSIEATTWRRR